MDNIRVILKYLNHEATEDELQELQHWIQQSEENQKEFVRIKNSFAIISSKLATESSAADFNELKKKVKPRDNQFSFRKMYRVAAAVFFPILLAASAWLIYTQFFQAESPVYTEVIAPPKHNSQVILSDGTHVWLSPESKLEYAQNFGEQNRNVKLEGEGYFEVIHNEKQPFIVETSDLYVKVLGTAFNVEAYPNDKFVRTTLVRGSVQVESDKFENEIVLTPGDRLSVDVASNEYSIVKVNTEIYRLVKEGLLIFKRNNLAEVCRKLERWFMVPIEYDGKGNQSLLFTAKFEDESLEEILKIVSETIPINYQIRNDKVVIKYKN